MLEREDDQVRGHGSRKRQRQDWSGVAGAKEIPVVAPAEAGLSADKLAEIDKFMEKQLADKKLAGGIVIVSHNGKIGFFNAYREGKRVTRDLLHEIADQFKAINISALVESVEQVAAWRDSRVGLFIDVNPGMDRTGIEQDATEEIIRLARAIEASGQPFRGLHYYDGHLAKYAMAERTPAAHRGYDRLIEIISALEQAGVNVAEVITAGTPAFPCTLSYPGFKDAAFAHPGPGIGHC